MKLIPILMSSPMVRANLEGRKTVTRTVVKPQPDPKCTHYIPASDGKGVKFAKSTPIGGVSLMSGPWIDHRFGQPGDLLWVRERWMYGGDRWNIFAPNVKEVFIQFDPHSERAVRGGWSHDSVTCIRPNGEPSPCQNTPSNRWRPSIHMPHWACRLVLRRVGEVRVERLCDISREDAIAEGMTGEGFEDGGKWPKEVLQYFSLWDELNGPGAAGMNPWVWVIPYELAATTHAEAQKLIKQAQAAGKRGAA